MSYCREEGKDKIIFMTKEDYETPSTATLQEDVDEEPGLILPSGEINWSCPCLGGMATGPCGNEFREAFSCFHYSDAEPKGSDCYEQFSTMQKCMSEYPELYDHNDDKQETAEGENIDRLESETKEEMTKEEPPKEEITQVTADNNDSKDSDEKS